MSNVQERWGARTVWEGDDIVVPRHDITVYTGSSSQPEYVAMRSPSRGFGVGTSDGGQLVGWYDSGYLMRATTMPPDARHEVAEIARGRREMAERLAAINAALKRIQEQLATVERAHGEQASFVRAPHLSALAWMKEATGLSDSHVAALLGVTRQAIVRWRRGEPIAADKRRRVLAVRDVLERAARLHSSVDELGAWLDTPQGTDGRTPGDLLAQGEIDKVRLLAVTHVSGAVVVPPAWVHEDGLHSDTRQTPMQSGLPPWYEDDIVEQDDETEPDLFAPLDLDGA